jgi:hypothetical protein
MIFFWPYGAKNLFLRQKSCSDPKENLFIWSCMKRVFIIVAIVVVAAGVAIVAGCPVYAALAGAFILLLLLGLFVTLRGDKADSAPHAGSAELVAITNKYGPPDDTIVVNPTRGNESDGVVLFYDREGFLYFNGIVIRKEEITDITFFNSAIPYVGNDYQIVITSNSDVHPNVYIPTGNDLGWANDVLNQIKSHFERG